MRIGIITLHRAENYGSVLQALALQLKLNELGHDAFILDYHPERYTNKGKLHRLKNQSPKFQNLLVLLAAKILIYPSYLRKNKIFGCFINNNIRLGSEKFETNEKAKQILIDADAYCTGSDQVWNSHWNECVEKALFLDFVPKGKLVFSYAASIGLSKLPKEEVVEVKALLEKYEYLSVREDTGVRILHELGRCDAIQTLDPTLLMDKNEWERYANDNSYRDKKYILTYNLHHDKKIDDYAYSLSRKYKLPVWNISYNWHDVIRKGHLCWCPRVEDFLGLIKNARFVIADSFHATVFSIVFERPFVAITPQVAGSRISSLLNLLGIGERNLISFSDTSLIEKPMDYVSIKSILQQERKKSMDFLRKATSLNSTFTHNK